MDTNEKAPQMTSAYKYFCLNWDIENDNFYREEERNIMFSDEKEFKLDGHDSNRLYWHRLGNDERIHSNWKFDAGSVMIWASFSYYGRSAIAFSKCRQHLECCVITLENVLIHMFQRVTEKIGYFIRTMVLYILRSAP